jgi:hypothetical protein
MNNIFHTGFTVVSNKDVDTLSTSVESTGFIYSVGSVQSIIIGSFKELNSKLFQVNHQLNGIQSVHSKYQTSFEYHLKCLLISKKSVKKNCLETHQLSSSILSHISDVQSLIVIIIFVSSENHTSDFLFIN